MMLEHLQTRFMDAIRGAAPQPGAAHAAFGPLGPSAIAPELTWQIYRNNYLEAHVAALQQTYPTVGKLVGAEYFRQLARQFVAWSDSVSGDLNEYGAGFADLLAGPLHIDALPYLADVARLDWARSTVLRAASRPADWLPVLLALDPARWPGVRVHAASVCLASDYPLHDIWLLAQHGGAPVSLEAGGQAILVSRTTCVRLTLLSEAEAAFTDCWLKRATLGQAFEVGRALDAQFDIASLLRRLASLGAVESLDSEPG